MLRYRVAYPAGELTSVRYISEREYPRYAAPHAPYAANYGRTAAGYGVARYYRPRWGIKYSIYVEAEWMDVTSPPESKGVTVSGAIYKAYGRVPVSSESMNVHDGTAANEQLYMPSISAGNDPSGRESSAVHRESSYADQLVISPYQPGEIADTIRRITAADRDDGTGSSPGERMNDTAGVPPYSGAGVPYGTEPHVGGAVFRSNRRDRVLVELDVTAAVIQEHDIAVPSRYMSSLAL